MPHKRSKHGKSSKRSKQGIRREGPDKYVIISDKHGSRLRSKHRLPAVCQEFRWYGGKNMSRVQAEKMKNLLDAFARDRYEQQLSRIVG